MANKKEKIRNSKGVFKTQYKVDEHGNKQCSVCKELKPIEKFSRLKKGFDYRVTRCKDCFNKIRREKYRKTPEQKKKIADYNQKNKKRIYELKKKWVEENREHYNSVARKRANVRRKEDMNYRLRQNISRRINHALTLLVKDDIVVKSSSSLKLLGCSMDDFKNHLEKQFDKDMSWNNYGDWELDHILPCARFNLADEFEQQICFNYLNYQPLWKLKNISKSDKIDETFFQNKKEEIINHINELNN